MRSIVMSLEYSTDPISYRRRSKEASVQKGRMWYIQCVFRNRVDGRIGRYTVPNGEVASFVGFLKHKGVTRGFNARRCIHPYKSLLFSNGISGCLTSRCNGLVDQARNYPALAGHIKFPAMIGALNRRPTNAPFGQWNASMRTLVKQRPNGPSFVPKQDDGVPTAFFSTASF